MVNLTKNKLSQKENVTNLCIGAMSKNCIDAVLEISNKFNLPLVLVSSRNQIETEQLQNGYVNNWTTEEFSRYVIKNDIKKNIILERDHGGPWQNDFEKERQISFDEAWDNAENSFISDIKSRFEILHIDPTYDVSSKLSIDEIINRICKFCQFCYDESKKQDKKIELEISVWSDGANLENGVHLTDTISKILNFCKKTEILHPSFFAIPTGNKILNNMNSGPLNSLNTNSQTFSTIKRHVDTCTQLGLKTKVHATDFLSDQALKMYPKLGIHAANVAPELGIRETTALIQLLDENRLEKQKEKFIELSYSSNKWKKWVSPNKTFSKQELSIICGHYVYSLNEFNEIKESIQKHLPFDLNIHLKQIIENDLIRFLKNFNLI